MPYEEFHSSCDSPFLKPIDVRGDKLILADNPDISIAKLSNYYGQKSVKNRKEK